MGSISSLYATLTPTPFVVPISNGSGLLDDWVTPSLTNPMTTDQDLIVGGFGGDPTRLAVGPVGYVLTVGSAGVIDWEPSSGGFVNPMTTSQDLIVGGVAGAPGRLGVGSVGKVLTVGSGGIIDWETPAASGGTVTTLSVVSANGFAGSVANPTTTPAITLTTTITGILSGNGTAISAASTTGSGAVVLATSPTLVTPALGTPSAVVLTNGTGLPISGITGLGTGIATFLATPSSANLAAAVTDETGTGLLVFGTAPTFASTMTVGTAGGTTGAINLVGTTSGIVTLSVAAVAGTNTFKLPATAGSNTNVLATDGSGNLFWQSAGAGGGTVNTGAINQIAFYAAAGTAVSGATGSAPVIVGVASTSAATGTLGTYGTTQANTNLFARIANASGSTPAELLLSHARGTIASPTATQSGDVLGRVCFGGIGTTWSEFQCLMRGEATEAWSGTVAGNKIVFATTANTTLVRTDALQIDQNGAVSALINVTATSTTTGSLISAGGLGVAGTAYFGGSVITAASVGMTAGGSGTSGIFNSAGVLDVRSQAGLNLSPSTTSNGILSVAGTATDIVVSDNTSFRTWQGSSGVIGRGAFIQRAANAAVYHALSVNTTASTGIEGYGATGSYGSLAAMNSGSGFQMRFFGYGGTTWVNNIAVQLLTTQVQSETARGSQILFRTTPNNSVTIATVLTLDQDATATFASSVKTGAPSGGTAGAWKTGILVTAAVTPDITRYIQLDVGGTLYKLIVST